MGVLARSLVALSLFCGLVPGRAAMANLGLVIGQPQTAIVQPQDTLLDIAFRHGLGFQEVTRLNPEVDVWLPKVGTRVLLPTQLILPDVPHEGLVINIPEMRLYDFSVGDTPEVFAIAIGDPIDPSPVVAQPEEPSASRATGPIHTNGRIIIVLLATAGPRATRHSLLGKRKGRAAPQPPVPGILTGEAVGPGHIATSSRRWRSDPPEARSPPPLAAGARDSRARGSHPAPGVRVAAARHFAAHLRRST